jgi:hypothetical protein
MQPGIVGMNDQSANRAYRTYHEDLEKNIFTGVISVEPRSFQEHIDNVEALNVSHNY